MLKKAYILIAATLMIIVSFSANAGSYDDKYRVRFDSRNGIQVSSPYARNKIRSAERVKRNTLREPSRMLNRAFRDFDRKLNNKINGR